MKLKFIIGVLLLFGMTELNGQNLESDSIYKHRFRNLKQLIKDAERAKIRLPKKKTKWEYEHYHANLTDTTFTFSKTKAGIVMQFKIFEDWREDSTGDCLRSISAKNDCGDVIWVNFIPVDDSITYLVIYYEGDNKKYYATYLVYRYE
jgi:hypothetical protein